MTLQEEGDELPAVPIPQRLEIVVVGGCSVRVASYITATIFLIVFALVWAGRISRQPGLSRGAAPGMLARCTCGLPCRGIAGPTLTQGMRGSSPSIYVRLDCAARGGPRTALPHESITCR